MNSIKIFKAALGIDTPWEVTKINFGQSEGKHELHINVNFRRSTKFKDTSGKECCVHDSKMKTWRHLNFFQHACYIHCRTPRIKDDNGKVSTVNVPWARSGSGFTLLFESYVMALIESEMPVNKVGRLVNENPIGSEAGLPRRLPTEPCVRDRTRLLKIDVPILTRQTSEAFVA